MDSDPETSTLEVPASRIVLERGPRLNQKFTELGPPLPQMTLSGLVPGRLTNRLGLRARAPRREESEEVGDVDGAVVVDVRCVTGIRSPCGKQSEQVRHVHHAVAIGVGRAG